MLTAPKLAVNYLGNLATDKSSFRGLVIALCLKILYFNLIIRLFITIYYTRFSETKKSQNIQINSQKADIISSKGVNIH